MGMKILVVGIGNVLMKDDGIGVYLCGYLKKKRTLIEAEIMELGVEQWRLSCIACDFKNVVLVDAVDMGLNPGQCAVWEDVDFMDGKIFSFHSKSFLSELCIVRAIRKMPEKIYLFGIQPEEICWGRSLSPTLQNRFTFIAEKLVEFIDFLKKEKIYALH
ncbi:MAG: hydrogenase maturation protease [Candidatus Omnitrophica bacterium]|nr:hydrogenase maturation protease [Candidatus Omnitrophota bacterium]